MVYRDLKAVVLFFLGIFYFVFFYKRTRSLLNPIGIFLTIWCLIASVSSLALMDNQENWIFETFIIVVLTSISIFAAGVFIVPKQKRRIKLNNLRQIQHIKLSNRFLFTTKIIFFVSLVCVLIELAYSNFYMPGLSFFSYGDKKNMVVAISGIHYGSILMPFCGIFAFFELLNTKKFKKTNILILLISLVFYSYIVTLSRGDMICIFLGCLYIYHFKYPIKMRFIIRVISAFLIIFVVIAFLRIPQGSVVFTAFGRTDIFSRLLSPIYSYISYGFQVLQKLIKENTPWTSLNYSLKFFWDLLGQRESLNLTLVEVGIFNSQTFIYPFYHDWKIFGVILFSFFIGAFVASIQKKALHDKRYILLIAITQKAIFMSFFGSYFFIDNVSIWPYIIGILLIFLLNKRKNYNARYLRV